MKPHLATPQFPNQDPPELILLPETDHDREVCERLIVEFPWVVGGFGRERGEEIYHLSIRLEKP